MTCIWRIHGSKPYILRCSLVYNTSVFCFSHFHLEGVGGWFEPNETNFIWKKLSHFETIPYLSKIISKKIERNNISIVRIRIWYNFLSLKDQYIFYCFKYICKIMAYNYMYLYIKTSILTGLLSDNFHKVIWIYIKWQYFTFFINREYYMALHTERSISYYVYHIRKHEEVLFCIMNL